MTCKDCLFFKRCVVLGVELDIKRNKEADKNCRHFINKSDYVEVKHGYWKHTVEFGNIGKYHYWNCSLCGVASVDEDREKYCHECGAKMDGGKAE